MKKTAHYIIAVFVPLHLLMITWTTLLPVLPFYQSITDNGFYQRVNKIFDYYLISTGNAQRWNLFTSVADVHGQEVVIEIVSPEGEKALFDPVFPGLQEHKKENIRHISLFLRFVYGMDSYVEPYMQRAMKEIEASGTEVKEGYLIINEQKTRYLQNIVDDGIIYYNSPKKFGPYELRR